MSVVATTAVGEPGPGLCVAGSIINKMSKDRRLTLVLLLDLLLIVALVIVG